MNQPRLTPNQIALMAALSDTMGLGSERAFEKAGLERRQGKLTLATCLEQGLIFDPDSIGLYRLSAKGRESFGQVAR